MTTVAEAAIANAMCGIVIMLKASKALDAAADHPIVECCAGGFVQLTTITADRVESSVVHRWSDDVVGKTLRG